MIEKLRKIRNIKLEQENELVFCVDKQSQKRYEDLKEDSDALTRVINILNSEPEK